MTAIGYDTTSGSIVISDNGVYGARTLTAAMGADGHVTITSLAGRGEFFIPWSGITDLQGNGFADGPTALAYLQTEFARRPVVGSPQRNYAVSVVDGQAVIPIAPEPSDVNTINLVVNGAVYAPPDIAVSTSAVTWQGVFSLASSDAVRVIYF